MKDLDQISKMQQLAAMLSESLEALYKQKAACFPKAGAVRRTLLSLADLQGTGTSAVENASAGS